VTYQSWFACPLLDLQAVLRTWVQNGGAPLMTPRYLHLDLPKHEMRTPRRNSECEQVSLASKYSRGGLWSGEKGHCDKCPCTTVQNEVHVLFQCQNCLCALSERSICSIFPFLPSCGGPLYFAYLASGLTRLVRLSLISFLNGTINSTIPSRTSL